jgi:hypothetical protein
MDAGKVMEQVLRFQSTSALEREDAWQQLKPFGSQVIPLFLNAYPTFKRSQARVSLLYYATGFARVSEEAFRLGVMGCADKASLVRNRACGLLAYSLRWDALPVLSELRAHVDQKTVEDATAAMDAICSRNHHYFADRSHSGRTFWEVNPGDMAPGYANF